MTLGNLLLFIAVVLFLLATLVGLGIVAMAKEAFLIPGGLFCWSLSGFFPRRAD